ncbi:conserved hypothetical protein [Candidatus Koribacter versatilis Ellin345]|uniref:DoxX n=1 Tax=Koribacter versatilis (strain Ellin345) TaxID=204669 RepID=Q1IKM4_KORVE|nr:DoxX family protein [Candidatus Koribacter versatilis]ABF42576.1 conserved hypothetical protein [Candidatus Koribacter versatilis Ellin345]
MMTKASGYWASTVLAALLFMVPGLGLLGRVSHFTDDMAHLGYPLYFLTFLGAWKVLGALAILAPGIPRVKEWAYAGMIFDLSGAMISRAVMGDGAVKVIVPCVVGCLVVFSWSLRPAGRLLREAT